MGWEGKGRGGTRKDGDTSKGKGKEGVCVFPQRLVMRVILMEHGLKLAFFLLIAGFFDRN